MAEHGTVARFERGCSCDDCRAANAADVKLRRKAARKRFKQGKIEIKHGTQTGYDYWGCKCVLCTEANTVRHREKRQRAESRTGS